MKPQIFITVCATVVLVSAVALAAPAAGPYLLSPTDFDPARLLPPPPSEGSAAAKSELEEILRIEKNRTPARLERAKSDDTTENASIFAEAIGPGFDLKSLPATAKMFADIRREERRAAALAKVYFKRQRPWIVEAAIQSCTREDAPDSSYPSGHATMGYSMAFVLAGIVPEKAQAVLARADEYAESRLVCGMHFRRDIEAGHVLGTAVALQLLNNAAFKAEYELAAAELRQALKSH